MDLIKRDSEHTKYKKKHKQTKQNKQTKKKLTNRFSNDIGHLISDKVRQLKRITIKKA